MSNLVNPVTGQSGLNLILYSSSLFNKILFQQACLDSEDPLNCIEGLSLNIEDLVLNASKTDWRKEYFNNFDGWFFTRNVSGPMTTDFGASDIFEMRQPGLYCQVILHDSEYFVRNVNPVAIPQLELELNADFGFKIVYLGVKRVEMMRYRYGDGVSYCDPSPNHSITNCVRSYVTKVEQANYSQDTHFLKLTVTEVVGCRMNWDTTVDSQSVPVCFSKQQFK